VRAGALPLREPAVLHAGGRPPLALDFQQRPGFGGFEPFLRQCTVGAQLVQFGGEVSCRAVSSACCKCCSCRVDAAATEIASACSPSVMRVCAPSSAAALPVSSWRNRSHLHVDDDDRHRATEAGLRLNW
jgi:hypothetical protein